MTGLGARKQQTLPGPAGSDPTSGPRRPLLIRNARVLRLGPGPIRGPISPASLRATDGCDVLSSAGRIETVGPGITPPAGARILEADGRVLMPGFVDCHTHACWAGERYEEWARRQAGESYLDILKSGGGIMATVRAVRAAPQSLLTDDLLARLDWMLAEGTTTAEVKSGYGLDTESELKMLRAIADADRAWSGTVVPTACIGHAVDPDAADHVDRTIRETLPAVADEFPGIAVDAYCESGAWTLRDCLRLFDAAASLGCRLRVHTDQFNALGMTEAAIARGLVSVDHLEASTSEALARVAASDTTAVLLPCSGFHTDNRYSDGRTLADAGAIIAVATNFNPGSSPCPSIPMALALAVRQNRLSPAEALIGVTANAAAVLGLPDRGRIEPGARADLVLLRHRDETALAHDFGGRHTETVVIAGEEVT